MPRPARRHLPAALMALAVAATVLVAGHAASAWGADAPPADWAGLGRYAAANAALPPPARGEQRVVFMGDSITEGWGRGVPDSPFADPRRVNRGISGQTTPQMLVRFRADVIALRPAAVVILAGTNDIAGNTGPATLADIEGHIASMGELARAHGIRVVLCALLPAAGYYWNPAVRPAPQIVALNERLRALARREGWAFVDLHTPMADAQGGLRREFGEDGVHPNAAGYALMRPLVEDGIRQALAAR